ncbi:MAG: MBL fold metallo-hydrolase [Acaryochloridaceae cyanobacterium RU_4_10]|nr:MBL fold metallo-hydrolase [Acaryochloridaceae cyanobacterium RU_4_10]
MNLTWFGSNSWSIEMAGEQVLLDPWFVGDLVFGNAPWFIRGFHTQPVQIPENVSLILLTQGLPDHAHPETLKKLDRTIPVVGPPSAAKVARSLGFETVTALPPAETFSWKQLEIKAFPGAPLGPQAVGNAYVLKDLESQATLYNEPHGYYSKTLSKAAPVDVVLTPLVGLNLPVLGPFIRGNHYALDLIQMLQPQVVLPTTTADGDVKFTGLLNNFISAQGSLDEFCNRLRETLPTARVIAPIPSQRMDIPLQVRAKV